MGLMVDEIVDIVEDRVSVELGSERPGVFGSAIIVGSATDIIDTGYYLSKAHGDWFRRDNRSHGAQADGDGKSRVLLVDDSAFFRNLLAPMLSLAGYAVTTVESATEALELCAAGQDFDIIVSDIEMPEMDGFEFASAVRAGGGWAEKPLVALSSRSTDQDLARGREVGFTDYVAKFDRDGLLQTLEHALSIGHGPQDFDAAPDSVAVN